MKPCKFKRYKVGLNGIYEKDENGELIFEWVEGTFLQWGSDYEKFETGAGNYTVAIVQLPDGSIETPVPVDMVF